MSYRVLKNDLENNIILKLLTMEEYITKEIRKDNISYIKIKNQDSLTKIYNLFKYKIFTEPTNEIEYLYYGVYYKIVKDYGLMKKYYLMAIDKKNDSNAMNNLGNYYKKVEKDYGLMKKYYLMAISQNNSFAMNNLGYYYENVKDYGLMKKYYLMAIDQNHSNAIDNLKIYYKNNENDHSFVELYKYEQFLGLFNERFNSDINLSQQYYYSFLQWKTDNNKIKMKQYILRKTGVFPRKYDENCLINFVEIVSLKNTILPKDMMYLIAGHLFV
jgi:tetratricopeptide (TPR) repeat protein